jgi:uracil-DNA glycosylase
VSREELLSIVSDLKRVVESSGFAGVAAWKAPAPPSGPLPRIPGAVPAGGLPAPVSPPPPVAAADGGAALEALRLTDIGDCRRCPLSASRSKIVFGVGNPKARVMLVGEGPGAVEDREGEPFVGPAGQLLDKMLAAVNLSRKPAEPPERWVYIANIVKCRAMADPSQPEKLGNDRAPSPSEIAECLPFLKKQVALIRPRVIVAMGNTAAKTLLATDRGITSLRGRWQTFSPDGVFTARLLPTYHPSALLRNPALKKDAWEDMKLLRAALDERPS